MGQPSCVAVLVTATRIKFVEFYMVFLLDPTPPCRCFTNV
jgi:hypothetical protein